MPDFRKTVFAVELSGEEWFAIMAKLAGKRLSDEGRTIARVAMESLGRQVATAADALPAREFVEHVSRSARVLKSERTGYDPNPVDLERSGNW